MTTHTDLIARLREMAGRLRLEAADALEALEQQVAALMSAVKDAEVVCDSYAAENQRLSDEKDALTKEREELMRDYRSMVIERNEHEKLHIAATAEMNESSEDHRHQGYYQSNCSEIFGRADLHTLVNKPSHRRNGPDIQRMHRSIDWLYDEREKLISEAVDITKELVAAQAREEMLRGNLEYIESYVEAAAEVHRELGGLLGDVRGFLAIPTDDSALKERLEEEMGNADVTGLAPEGDKS